MDYFGLIGTNGMGVMDSLDKVNKCRKHLHDLTICRFDSFVVAEAWTRFAFAKLHPKAERPVSLKRNQILFTVSHLDIH